MEGPSTQRCPVMQESREDHTAGWTVSGRLQMSLDERAVTDSWRAASPRGLASGGSNSPALLDVRTLFS